MTRIDVKASGLWRTLEIIGGAVVIALAFIALADPEFAVKTLLVLIAAGLIIGGLLRISVGVFAMILPSGLRTLNTAGGVIALVLGIVAFLDLQALEATLIFILALALLLVGAFEIGVGIARHPPVWLRVAIVAIGALTITLSASVILYPSIGEGLLAAILALALLLVGTRNIVHGITGHHRVPAPIDTTVTAA